MAKFLYNTSDIYTLLFRSGSIEIRPLKYVKVEDQDYPGFFQSAVDSKQVDVFENETDVPNQLVPNRMELGFNPPSAGLTEDQLKAEMAQRELDKKPVETQPIGKSEEEFKPETPVEPVVEPVETTETEEVTEAAEVVKRGRKAKSVETTPETVEIPTE